MQGRLDEGAVMDEIPKRARLDILTKLTLERLVNTFSEAAVSRDETSARAKKLIEGLRAMRKIPGEGESVQ